MNNVSEVVEYYYEYYYDYVDISTNESVVVSDTVLSRQKRELDHSSKLSISTELSRHDAFYVRGPLNSEAEIIFKVVNFDMSSLEAKQYIQCDLQPVAKSLPSSTDESNHQSKVGRYLHGLVNLTIGKVITVADVSSSTVSPLSLVNFKCARARADQATPVNYLHSLNNQTVMYVFIVLNVLGLALIILMLKYMICKSGNFKAFIFVYCLINDQETSFEFYFRCLLF